MYKFLKNLTPWRELNPGLSVVGLDDHFAMPPWHKAHLFTFSAVGEFTLLCTKPHTQDATFCLGANYYISEKSTSGLLGNVDV
jgi:hypothetical protein